MPRFLRFSALLACAVFAAPACVLRDHATDLQGMPDHEGNSITHMNRTAIGLNLLLFQPFYGDGTLETNLRDMAAEAKAEGADGLRIVQSDERLWWWVFPPFSFIITPQSSNCAADFVHRNR